MGIDLPLNEEIIRSNESLILLEIYWKDVLSLEKVFEKFHLSDRIQNVLSGFYSRS